MNYDKVFEQAEYNKIDKQRIKQVQRWLAKGEHILDVGCGRGHYLKQFLKAGYTVTGLEPSRYVIEHDLKKLPVVHGKIEDIKDDYDALYCMDVLEHIDPEEIDKCLAKLAKHAPKALYGIANHSDMWDGVELHLIQQPAIWWFEKLRKYYSEVQIVEQGDRFNMFDCHV